MKLSIITVNRNNAAGLRTTMQSVAKQTCRDFEYIVIDGDSDDGSVEVIKEYEKETHRWVSEPDGGIYEAMNKGVSMASGDYVLFLNSGDALFAPTTVGSVISLLADKDFYLASTVRNERGGVKVCPPAMLRASYLLMHYLPHQATFIRRQLLLERPYRTQYRIAADWEQMVYELVVRGGSYETIDVSVTLFDTTGISSIAQTQMQQAQEREQILKEHFPDIVVNDYRGLSRYENKIKYALLKEPSPSRDWKILRNALKMLLQDAFKKKSSRK